MPGDEVRSARAHAVRLRGALRRGDQARVGGEAEIVVAAEVQQLAAVDAQPRALRRIHRPSMPRQAGGVARGERSIELRDQPLHAFRRDGRSPPTSPER
jgi:hypothetical protein